MYTTNLRKVGGSVMLALPPAILDLLSLRAGATVGVSVECGKLMIVPHPRPHYSLDELLTQCDALAELSSEDRQWLDTTSVGHEIM